jgi:hypothetical protein
MFTMVLGILPLAIVAVLLSAVGLRWSTNRVRAELAAETTPADARVRDGAVRAYRNPVQRAQGDNQLDRAVARSYHPAVRPEGSSFDEAVAQALQVANAKDEPKDPSSPKDPVTMPKKHPANCQCSRCRTSSEVGAPVVATGGPSTDPDKPREHVNNCQCDRCKSERPRPSNAAAAGPAGDGAKLRCPTCKKTTCKGCSALVGPVETAHAVRALWADLSTDQQFALAHDRLLDTAAPASLRERSYR